MGQHDTAPDSTAGFDTAKFQRAFLSELHDAGMIDDADFDSLQSRTNRPRKNTNESDPANETMTTTYEFEKLSDDELRERVLEAVETLETRMDSTPKRGGNMLHEGSPSPSKQAVQDLKDLFGGDGIGDEEVEWI